MTQVLQLPIIQKSILLYFDVEFDIAINRVLPSLIPSDRIINKT